MRVFLWLAGLSLASLCHADIAVIAHTENTLTTLAPADIKRIFLKQTRVFPDGNPVLVGTLPPDIPVTQAFYQRALKMSDSQWRTYWAQYAFNGQKSLPVELNDQKTLRQWVANTPGALGFIHVDWVDDSVKVLRTLEMEPGLCGNNPGCD